MARYQQYSLLALGRMLVLLLLVGQPLLLFHETGHISDNTGTNCQVCLHAQPQATVPPEVTLQTIEPVIACIAGDYSGQQNSLASLHAYFSRAPPLI